jgi:hypothetical protein
VGAPAINRGAVEDRDLDRAGAEHEYDLNRASARTWDVAAPLLYLAAAVAVTANLWANPQGRMLAALGGADNVLFEWFAAHGAHAVTDLDNPLLASSMNAPAGVNMMANTSVLGLTIPMTPVTLLFGPLITVKLLLVFALAGTAWSWYFVLSRQLVSSRMAAVLGGAFCGFAPGPVSQVGGSHLQIATQILVPFIVWRVVRLGEAGRTVRNGVLLGLLVAYQAFIGEEVLLLTALACGVLVVSFAVMCPKAARDQARPFLAGLGVAAGVAAALLAYPLWVQFRGPQHYRGLPFDPEAFYADLASYYEFASESWLGGAQGVARTVTEENTFYGPVLCMLVAVAVAWLWRKSLAARLAAVVVAVFFALSLGSEVIINGTGTGVAGPWALLKRIPPFDLTMATRLALVLVPAVGVVLALFADRLWAPNPLARAARRQVVGSRGARDHARLRWVAAGTVALVAALVPIAPTVLPTLRTPTLPAFFADGTWRQYLPPGTTIVPAPVPYSGAMDGAHWLANTGEAFATPGGYFIVPTPDGAGAQFTSDQRRLGGLLLQVNHTGWVPTVTERDRRAAIEDLRYWNAGLIVLEPGRYHGAQLRELLSALFGPPQEVGGVLLWPTKDLLS